MVKQQQLYEYNTNNKSSVGKSYRYGGTTTTTPVGSFRRKGGIDDDNDTNFDYDIDCDYSHKDMISTTDASSVNFDVSFVDVHTRRSNATRLDDYYDNDDDDYNNNEQHVNNTVGDDDDETNNNDDNNLNNQGRAVGGSTGTTPSPTSTTTTATTNAKISISELVKCIGNEQRMLRNTTLSMSPEVERRVRDFRLAQQKRKQKYGPTKRFGVFGMYSHLHNVRIDLEWVEDAAYRRINNKPYLSWNDYDTAKLRTRSIPYFSYSLITICTIMLLVEFAFNEWQFAPLNVNPMLGPSPEALIRAGARDTMLIVEEQQWYRLFSPLVLHAGIIHYLINMIAFALIGIAVEQSHGGINTMLLFLVPGVGGNILSAIFLPKYISVGASGGIFGLLGACTADIIMNWALLFIKNSSDEDDKQVFRRNFWCVFCLIAELFINIILGLITPFIDNWTHLGGLLYGMCCAFTLLPTVVDNVMVGVFNVSVGTCGKIRMYMIRFLGLIITLLLIMASTIWLATSDPGEKPPCSGCRYISCIPFPPFQEKKWRYCDDCDMVVGELYIDKSTNYYDKIDLTCPNNAIVSINVAQDNITDSNVILRNLPTYCRAQCSSLYSN